MPIIPATLEAEVGESLEPGKQRLQRANIMPLHSNLGDMMRLHLKKNKLQDSWAQAGHSGSAVIPVLRGAEEGGSLELRSLRPAWATQRDPVSSEK